MANPTFHRVARRNLYEAVWSEPIRTIAPRFDVSDVVLAKVCRRAAIPIPERGFWAKRKVGAAAQIPKLTPRPLGMSEELVIGRGYNRYWDLGLSEAELLKPVPDPPTFAELEDEVRRRAAAAIRKVPSRAALTHPSIRKLLEEDALRRKKQLLDRYTYSWDKPRFDSPVEKRRLKILSALFIALARSGATPWLRNYRHDPLEFGVRVGHQQVIFDLTPIVEGKQSKEDTTPDLLRLSIKRWRGRDEVHRSWQDDSDTKLEDHLTTIAVELLVSGELMYRESVQSFHSWRIERKRNLEECIRREKEEAERRERERLAALQQARIDRLMKEAAALRLARDIRAYVVAVRTENERNGSRIPTEEVESWAHWALQQADTIDPVRRGAFLSSELR